MAQQPKGTEVQNIISKIQNDTNICNRQTIKQKCNKNNYGETVCNNLEKTCVNTDKRERKCNINSSNDDASCLTCNEVIKKHCPPRNKKNECKDTKLLRDICSSNVESFTNINNSSNILLYIIFIFLIYKIIYKN